MVVSPEYCKWFNVLCFLFIPAIGFIQITKTGKQAICFTDGSFGNSKCSDLNAQYVE
jgi:hypothetical protein